MKLSLVAGLIALAMAGCAPPAAASSPEMFVYRGAGCTGKARMASFERLLGRRPDGVVEFSERSDWAHMLTSINWALDCWQGTPYRLAQSVPMLMDRGTSLAEGANGRYDAHFRALGELLVRKGHANAYLRIGWEFNGGWYSWAAKKDPEAFRRFFRRIVITMRKVPGQRFVIVWNPAQGEQQIAPDKLWPGDPYVDIVAIDLYNQSWAPADRLSAAVRWNNLVNQPYGLAWLARFAGERGKPLALPEWGTGTRPDGHGMGDDPLFIQNVATFLRSNNSAFAGYWDYKAGDFDGEISTGRQPLSASAFRRSFARP